MSTIVPNLRPCAFYAGIGSELSIYRVDVANKALARIGSVQLPEQIQYAWQHPSKPFFYVASSSGYVSSKEPAAGVPVGQHYLNAFRLDEGTGALEALGGPAPLPSRPIHITVDRTGDHILAAHPNPAGITVRGLNMDGTIGREVKQTDELDIGIYPHQIMVTPSNQTVILPARGNNAHNGRSEEPGALKVFDFRRGVLANKASIALNEGYGYGPRHLDFHPTRPWVYVSFERQNEIHMYKLLNDGGLSPQPCFIKSTLADRSNEKYKQGAGAIHIHPNGRTVYVANRSNAKPNLDGKKVYLGGEDNIAVFAIDEQTGEPTLVQAADTHGFHPRTFAVDPSGRMLMSSAQTAMLVDDGGGLESVPAGISTFDIGEDGKLEFARKYPLDTTRNDLWWSGLVVLAK